MKSILKKELNSFFSSPIGYLVISVYLVFNGLFLWVFEGDFNILHAGFADLNSYFFLAPWIFIFLIPAITMRSFSDEINTGTIEILKTKPITTWQLILGKYLGALILVILAIIPTLIYVYSIYQLGNQIGNLNFGVEVETSKKGALDCFSWQVHTRLLVFFHQPFQKIKLFPLLLAYYFRFFYSMVLKPFRLPIWQETSAIIFNNLECVNISTALVKV